MTERARLAEIVGRLSRATDLGAGIAEGSALRTAIAATSLATELGLPPREQHEIYYAALLRYLGCTSFSVEASALGAGDDLSFLATFEAVDPTDLLAVSRTAVRDLARDASFATRAAAIARVLSDPKGYAKLATAHCTQAAALAGALGMSTTVVTTLRESYERFDGKGHPTGARGEAISLGARVLHVAWAIDVQLRHGGPIAAVENIRKGRGNAYDPNVAQAFLDAAPATIARMTGPMVWETFLDAEPTPHRTSPADLTKGLARAFACYVDLKSGYTLHHSVGVADLARRAAHAAGLSPEDGERLEIAALLHDLGRVAVPNGIWDKRGALGAMERERVTQHADVGDRIVSQCAALAPYAAIAGAHHERLDGSGYPRRLGGQAIGASARLLAACDVFHALGEERPHRPALSRAAAIATLRDEAAAGRLDRASVERVLEASGASAKESRVKAALPCDLTEREAEVLRHVATGKTNAEIGKALFISPKTVKVHVERIYGKTGVKNRAAAALFAVTHDIAEASRE